MASRVHPLNVRDESYVSDPVEGLMMRWNECRTRPITRLTSDKDTIVRAISRMRARDNTYIPTGIMWGWRLLSNSIPFTEASPYNGGNKKVMVVMTDGKNTISTGEKNWYINQGARPLESWHDGNDTNEANVRTAELCVNVKDEDIIVYTIAFEVADNDIRNLLAQCAGNGGRYFDASNAGELAEAFREIADDLSNLRLSK